MSAVAKLALDNTEAAEVRLYGEIKVAGASALATFEFKLDQMPECLSRATPGSMFVMAIVQLDDEGIFPKPLRQRSRGRRFNAYAHVVCDDPEFQAWARRKLSEVAPEGIPQHGQSPADIARMVITRFCEISNRGRLIHDVRAQFRFGALMSAYHADHGRRFFVEMSKQQETP